MLATQQSPGVFTSQRAGVFTVFISGSSGVYQPEYWGGYIPDRASCTLNTQCSSVYQLEDAGCFFTAASWQPIPDNSMKSHTYVHMYLMVVRIYQDNQRASTRWSEYQMGCPSSMYTIVNSSARVVTSLALRCLSARVLGCVYNYYVTFVIALGIFQQVSIYPNSNDRVTTLSRN